MTPSPIERRLAEAFDAARSNTTENADLFSRINRSVAEDRARRSWRRRSAAWATGYVLALGTIAGTFGNTSVRRLEACMEISPG